MINKNYLNLNENYLFSQISKNVKKYKEENLNLSIISLGIGDVTRPLVPEIVEAFREASHEMGQKETFRGYGDEQGYLFLIEEICKYYEKKILH